MMTKVVRLKSKWWVHNGSLQDGGIICDSTVCGSVHSAQERSREKSPKNDETFSLNSGQRSYNVNVGDNDSISIRLWSCWYCSKFSLGLQFITVRESQLGNYTKLFMEYMFICNIYFGTFPWSAVDHVILNVFLGFNFCSVCMHLFLCASFISSV